MSSSVPGKTRIHASQTGSRKSVINQRPLAFSDSARHDRLSHVLSLADRNLVGLSNDFLEKELADFDAPELLVVMQRASSHRIQRAAALIDRRRSAKTPTAAANTVVEHGQVPTRKRRTKKRPSSVRSLSRQLEGNAATTATIHADQLPEIMPHPMNPVRDWSHKYDMPEYDFE